MSYIPAISIPPGFKEDSKKFTVSSVGASPVAHQLTELEDGSEYIIKEVRVYFNGTPSDDAYFHLNTASSDNAATRFAEGYYWEGSFRMFDGNLNGKINDTLTAKPYLFVSAGTGASAQTVYGSVRYYYK
ncbi:MAG: hypothetical protein DRN81_05340 [Thermoproteota archaeon]|nr:MAG: hypothetical protein DRN81_05340 [Candidatus Korarchaeota archaeon]